MTDPETSLYEHYRSTHVRSFDGDEAAYLVKVRYFHRRLNRLLPCDKSAAILDLACGAGEFLYLLKEMGYTNCVGIDISPEQIARARLMGVTNAIESGINNFLEAPPSTYDFILASHILEHMPKLAAVEILKAVASRLAASGILVVMTPNAGSPLGLPLAFGDLTHQTFFSGTSLAQLARLAGFEVLHLGGVSPGGVGIQARVRQLAWPLLKRLLRTAYGGDDESYKVLEPELLGVFGLRIPGSRALSGTA